MIRGPKWKPTPKLTNDEENLILYRIREIRMRIYSTSQEYLGITYRSVYEFIIFFASVADLKGTTNEETISHAASLKW